MSNNFMFDVNYTISRDKSDDDNERDPFSFRYAKITDLGPEESRLMAEADLFPAMRTLESLDSLGRAFQKGRGVAKDPVHVHDFHATLLHLFGLNHLKLTYRFKGLDFRLTDQAGTVVEKVFG